MIMRALAFAVVIGLFVSIGTVFLSLILSAGTGDTKLFGWPSPFIKMSRMRCESFAGNCPLSYDLIPQNLLIDWGIFSFIFFLLLIILYKTNILK